jgi:mannose-6-phosphate isomerase-like protein (cupin superfamily)
VFTDLYRPPQRSMTISFNEKDTTMTTATTPKIVGPRDGDAGSLGSIGVRCMIDTAETFQGGFSLVEHPLPPRRLAAPLHRHTREDEYSYVLEGRMGALLGDDVVYAGPGDLVHKPRNQWHTFWNAGDEPARILEIIAPGGFEDFFRELVALVGSGAFSPEAVAELGDRYGLEMDPTSIPGLCERFGLEFGGPVEL